MKKSIVYLILLICAKNVVAQDFTLVKYKWDNRNRKYTYHIPAKYYTENKAVPLVMGLHGFGDDIENFKGICMTSIADSANYIVVYPEALPEPTLGSNAWNSGASIGNAAFNAGVDDIGFLNDILDTMIAKFNIDTNRIYVFGYSFGGFMAHRMGAEVNHRIASIAAVSGLVGNKMTALPNRGIPVLYFHGTADQTINYFNCPYGKLPPKTVDFWVNQNQCDTIPLIDTLPDLKNDGKRVIHYTYSNGRDFSIVEFYKVINGEHEWLSAAENDISYCQTIWIFFKKYQKNGLISTPIKENIVKSKLFVYPNPATHFISVQNINVSGFINIYNTEGKIMDTFNGEIPSQIDISTYPKGTYYVIYNALKSAKFIKL